MNETTDEALVHSPYHVDLGALRARLELVSVNSVVSVV